jgi:hypothetical protein
MVSLLRSDLGERPIEDSSRIDDDEVTPHGENPKILGPLPGSE